MRGAIAEVEDYARVSVATRSQAALTGSAVADVIHLLAELIENATTLSPPYTSVRVSGDTVANGFAIEVEDRGLGMSPTRLAEVNDRLANPPEFNPSDTDQLGLFVVSQLAKRHGIRVTLKASAYGGTAAIVLIPQHLVVTGEAFRSGLPGEPAMAQLTANGSHTAPSIPSIPVIPAELAGQASGSAISELDGRPGLGQLPGVRISGPLRRSQGIIPLGTDGGGPAAAAPAPGPAPAPAPALGPANGPANGTAGDGPDDLPRRHGQRGEAGQAANGGAAPFGGPPSSFDVFMPRRQGPGETPGPASTWPGAGTGAPSPANGAYIASPPYPGQPAPFPGWTSPGPPGPSGGRAAPGPGAPATPMTPVASPRPVQASGPPWELSRATGPLPAVPDPAGPSGPAAPGGPSGPDGSSGPDASSGPGGPNGPGTDGDINSLPRRVRQASLAPQLRDNPPPRRTTLASNWPSDGAPGPAGNTGPAGPSPTEIRQTMSALQRGWQEGRSRRLAEQAADEPAGAGPGSPAGADPDTAPADDTSANEEARGDSDGS